MMGPMHKEVFFLRLNHFTGLSENELFETDIYGNTLL